jgi:hypothetical protein
MVVLFKYKLPGNGLGGGACMGMQATNIVQYLDRDAESKLIAKLRRALIFSVLSTIMKSINGVYKTVDIVTVALSIYFICTLISTGSLITTQTQRRFHITYILHCACRQSVLVISDSVANSIHMRDVGTQYDNTLLLFISTTTFIAALTFVPKWFIHDTQQGSLKDILMFSFTYRYGQVHIPGLSSRTGIGSVLYGLLFTLFSMSDSEDANNKTSEFIQTLNQAAAMIFSRLFISQIVPESNTQIFPIAILLAMYIVSDCIPMSGSVAAFVLWRTAIDVSEWVSRILPGGTADQLILFSMLLGILPTINRKISAVFAVAALQTIVTRIMITFTYLSATSTVIASIGLLLVTDIVLDIPE